MASVEARWPLLRCSHWDPESLPTSVSARSVEIGTARQGRDGRRWVCCEISVDTVSDTLTPTTTAPSPSSSSSSTSASPSTLDLPPRSKSATVRGAQAGAAAVDRARIAKPPDRTPTTRSSSSSSSSSRSSPKAAAAAAAAAAATVDKRTSKTRVETKTVSAPPRSRLRVWALAADEAPVWRRANRSGLHNRDWWRHSTIAGIDAFEVRDYGARGDCFFLAVTGGLRHNFAYFREWSAAQQLRELVAAQITPRTVDEFLESERRDRRLGPRVGADADTYGWRPDAVARLGDVGDRVRALQRIVKTAGNTYWGDRLTLTYLCRSSLFRELDVGFVVFTADGVVHPEVVTSRDADDDGGGGGGATDRESTSERKVGRPASATARPRHIMLLYNSGAHWQLVFFCSSRRPAPKSGATAPVSTRSASVRKTPPPPLSTAVVAAAPKFVEQRDAVVRLPARAASLPEPLRNVFAASWGRSWWTTLGYSANGK